MGFLVPENKLDNIFNLAPNKNTNKKELSTLVKRFEKVVFKEIDSRLLSNVAEDIVSSFKLEPFDKAPVDVPTEKPVDFTVPGFDGEFGDGADAKGDGVV